MKKSIYFYLFVIILLSPTVSYAQDDASGAIAAGIFGIFSSLFFCCYALFFLAIFGLFIFWIIMVIDVLQRPDEKFPNPSENTKLLWILIVLLTNWIGAIVYYFTVKRKLNN